MKYSLCLAVALGALTSSAALADSHALPDQAAIIEQALAGGDPATGESVFRKCQACHEVGPDAAAKVGPPLNGIVGSFLGQTDDFRYSNTMVEMGEAGTAWTVENLDAYPTKPRDFVDRTRMTFAGLRDADDRADVIAFLASMSGEAE